MSRGQRTKKQHYIPRMLLKRFTYFRIPMRKPLLHQYDIEKGIERLVSVESCCIKKNLYELLNAQDKYMMSNYLENNLSLIENRCNAIIDKIEQNYKRYFKVKNEVEYLTKEERYTLILFIVLQFFRMPLTQKMLCYLVKESLEIKENITENEIATFCKIMSLDYVSVIQGKYKATDIEFTPFIHLFAVFLRSELRICFSKYNFLLNCTLPITYLIDINITQHNITEMQWVFPISPHICIMLSKNTENIKREVYKAIGKEGTQYLNDIIVSTSDKLLVYKEVDEVIVESIKK